MVNTIKNKVINTYKHIYNQSPAAVVKAPGRVNLIGEHTDYSDGFVLPVAINLGIQIALTPQDDRVVKLYSIDFDEHVEIDLTALTKGETGWQEYVKGVAWALKSEGYQLSSWQGVVTGDIPIGAGLSSSAAMEVAVGKAFAFSSKIAISPTKLAEIGKKAESEWVGVNVGIMDQLASAAGKAGHAVMLDCKTLDFEHVPIPEKVSMILLDTKTRRELSHSAYNTRHEQVKQASAVLGVKNLREASLTLLEDHKEALDPIIYNRARHVLTENKRVHAFSSAMRYGDLHQMGRLINASHVSLRDDFEVSSQELDLIVHLAQQQPVCLGARMTGAGFGGCALALIENQDKSGFIKTVHQAYAAETGIQPHIFQVESADGVHAVLLDELNKD